MKKLYVFTDINMYHVGFHEKIICIASNIEDACTIINENLENKYIGKDGIKIIKNNIKEFDLNIGIK